ncbi:hypothetical protein EAH88_19140 [Rhodanobacter glycinis]|uniref:Homing endonuclease LAGLIDADG domain-containing protein n=1 Tax=Rhodanobacter glycinis TaxID=582702 RepID=A0A502BVJ4_9GAMM|nr:LAGLIDADG endonuclease [Rhodanobacter glycinis]TPG03869.1 hypothetical protein EAH88_19140 [Rhodanobacter glycinis]
MLPFTGGVHSSSIDLFDLFPHFLTLSLIPLRFKGENEDYLGQAMVGLLLGDGSLVKKYAGGATYFKYAQGKIHYEYIIHVFSLFKQAGVVLMSEPSMGTTTLKGVVHVWYQFSTQSLTTWNALHAIWYVNGVKVIPENIYHLLTPIALAYWLIDDGGWTKGGIHLATNSFTPDDTKRLAEVLSSKYGLKVSIHSRNRIYIWARSVSDFSNIVRPYIHPSMSYKITPVL